MQSKTSFFNGTLFRKNVSRFWPVWGAYFAIWFLMVPIVLLANRYDRTPIAVQDFLLNTGFVGGMIMSALFGVFSAMAVWSFAYNTRSAHGTACLPVRREGVFASVTLAGLLPYLVVNAVIAVLALLAELVIGAADLGATLQMFCLMTLPFLLFYGFAALCAQLTGNILVLPAVYAVLNFVCVGAELLVRYLTSLFVYGMNQDIDVFALKWFSPFVAILMRCRVINSSFWTGECYTYEGSYFTGWNILIIYAVIGVALLIPALLLYRRRKMETAGDVVAIEVLKPVFRWCMAIGCALCLAALVCTLFWENSYSYDTRGTSVGLAPVIVTMLIGAFLGWFIAEMLIKKSFRVFSRSSAHWGGLGICCLILAGLMLACEFDLFGYERFVPDPEKVENVTVWCMGEAADLEAPESIEAVTAVHRSIVDNKAWHEAEGIRTEPDDTVNYTMVKLYYTLRSGRAVSREYDIRYTLAEPGDAGLVQDALNCPEAITDRKATRFPITIENITDSTVSSVMTAAECTEAAGYGSAEEYVLREYCGLSGSELNSLSAEDREEMLISAVAGYSVGGAEQEKFFDAHSVRVVTRDIEIPDLSDSSLDGVRFRYEWHFTPAQMMELYETCILPDIADNTLGRVWIISDEEYRNTVYSVEISIHAETPITDRTPEGVENPMEFVYFNTTPTVHSVRTNAWLAAHGVKQYTIAEMQARIGQ